MIYLNLKTATLRAPEYIGSEPTQRGTWLNLLCYCCEQENSGIITNCAGWKDRQWQQTAGVTLEEVQSSCDLWQWHGNDLAVLFYPADKQAEVQAKREAGRRGGKKSGQARRPSLPSEAPSPAMVQADDKAEVQAVLEAELERKGKERNGIERNGSQKPKTTRPKVAEVSATNDKDWLLELSRNPAYSGIDLDRELGKMQVWCAANRKMATRRRFVNWLNRADRPMNHKAAPAAHKATEGVWHLEKRIDAAQREIERIQSNPDNKEYVPDSFDRRLKPQYAATVKSLKAKISEMRQAMAGIQQEGATL